jgi:hypothetical protein
MEQKAETRRYKGLMLRGNPNLDSMKEWVESTIKYLGTFTISGRKGVECYWWSYGSGGGTFYGYYGNGEHEYVCSQLAFARPRYDGWKGCFEALESGTGMDETRERL